MSVDFSQFFNGPIRESLIAQVSDYLDISRQQATTAYDKAVALVIGAMARQAGKPEGARELAAHIHNSQTQSSLTSSALSPTVLTNDQFAQIVTLGQSEQAVILGAQQEAVTSHLEVATGLDTQAVGSLLSIVVPFVLSFLKNNITTESTPAKTLPVLLATQAPHVAAQLDAPALAALGEESLEGLFGADALAAADANTAAASPNGRQGDAQGAAARDKPANGWFKWVLTLAVVLAGAAWIKSCTQSDTADTENAKPAAQQQSTADAPAAENVTATPATPVAPAADTSTGEGSKATESGGAAEPSANFPEPAATQSASPGASAATGEGVQAGQEQSETTQQERADPPATPDSTATAAATDAAESASATPAESNTDGPTYGQASDSMEPDAQEGAASATAPASADTSAAGSSTEPAGQQATEAMHETGTGGAPADTTETGHTSSEQEAATQDAAATTSASDASGAAAEQAATGSTATDNATTSGAAADSTAAGNAVTDNVAADNAASGKTTTFAEPAPLAEKPAAAAAEQTAAPEQTTEPQDTTGKTTTFGESEAFDSAVKPAQSQEGSTDQPSDTPAESATGNGGAAQPSASDMSSGKTTTFGSAEPDTAASANPAQTDGTAASAGAAGQSAVSTADSAQANGSAVARVQLERDGDALRISGTVPSESARNRILNAAKLIDGHSKIEDELKVDSQAAALAFDDYSGLLSLLRGYHDVNVSLERAKLTLTGQVSSDAEKETLTTRVQNLLGGSIQVDNQASVVASAQTAATQGAKTPATIPLVQFASGSAQVDSRFHDSLDKYAQQLKENGKSVRLVGYADESGSEPGNETLSQRRAESVKAYLILRGVQARQIQTEGQGTQAPVADNTTQEGRARNRRVEIHEQ